MPSTSAEPTDGPNLPVSPEERAVLLNTQRGTPIKHEEAERRLQEALHEALRDSHPTLIAAPTGLGKTYAVASTPWREYPELTGGRPVIHISQTREARDTAIKYSKDAGVKYHVLKARDELCPVASGDYDDTLPTPGTEKPSEWFHKKCNTEGIPFGEVHGHLHAYLKRFGGLPCSRKGRCKAITQYFALGSTKPSQGDVEETEDEPTFDVIHATASFAFLPELIKSANVIFDECPTYEVSFNAKSITNAITALLRRRAAEKAPSWEELIELSKDFNLHTGTLTDESHLRYQYDGDPREDPELKFEKLQEYAALFSDDLTAAEKFEQYTSVHALAPNIGRAIIDATSVGNDRYRGQDGLLTVVFEDNNNLRVVLNPPDLSAARRVIGLDAHPSQQVWELQTGLAYTRHELLTAEEDQFWRTSVRNLYVIQIGTTTNPLTNGWRNIFTQRRKAEMLLEALHNKYGPAFRTCIFPKSLESDIPKMMENVGIVDPEWMTYGSEKSRNDFSEESVGLLLGCIDPGDNKVLNDLALLGLSAAPETVEDEDGESRRAYGRGFVGPDAEAADEFLRAIRETHVAQSIGRYARDVRNPDSGAVVYVWTDAIPEGMVDERVPDVSFRPKNKYNEIVDYIQNNSGPITLREVATAVGVRKEYAWKVVTKLEKQGVVTVSEGTGKYGANEYEYVEGTRPPAVDLTIRRE